jgi:hypothetical protein
MSSSIKLDIEFSLVVEIKLTVVDTGYFVGLTPIGNFQTQSEKVNRWIHIEDELRQVNSKNFAKKIKKKRRPNSLFMKEELWVSFVASYLCLEPC